MSFYALHILTLNETPYKFKITNTCDYIAKTNIAVNVLKTSSISQLASTTQGVLNNIEIYDGVSRVWVDDDILITHITVDFYEK